MSFLQVPHQSKVCCCICLRDERCGRSASLLVDVDGELLAAVNEKKKEVKRFIDEGKVRDEKYLSLSLR